MNTIDIPIALIDDNPYQARTTYTPDGIERLAESIKASGLLQPPMGRLVDAVKGRSVTADEFTLFMADVAKQRCSAEELLEMHGCRVQIAFGHRRLRAFYHLDAVTMPITLANLDEEKMYLLCYEENERRSELNAIEQAVSIDMAKQQFGWTDEQIAERLKLDRSTVAKTRSLLRLPDDVQKKVRSGEISKRNAIALIPLFELPESIRAAAQKGWSDHTKPSVILKQAATLSPTEIRQRIDSIVSANSRTITCNQEREHTDSRVVSPRCTDCPVRRKRGGVDACLNPECHSLKIEVEQQEQLMEGIRRTGLPALNESEKPSLNWIAPEHLEAFLTTPCEHRRLSTGNSGVFFDKELPHCRVTCAADKRCVCASALTKSAQDESNEQRRIAKIKREKRLKFIIRQFIERLLDRDIAVWKAVAGRHTADSLFANDASVEAYIGSMIFYPLTNAANTYSVRDFDDPANKFEQWAVEQFGITPYSDETAAVEPLIAQLSELEQRVNGWSYVDADEWYQALTQLRVLRSQLIMVTGLDDINGRCAALANTLKHYESVNAATPDDEDDEDEDDWGEGNDNE